MATLTIFSSTADGRVSYQNPSWSTCRNAGTGNAASTADNSLVNGISGYYASAVPTYAVFRSFFYFDLSGESGTADSVSLFLYSTAQAATSVSAQLGTQAATLTTADFDSFSGSSYGNVTWAASQYNEIVFNAQGISDVDDQIGAGEMKVCAREYDKDYLNVTPTLLSLNGVVYANNGTNKPYLEIETSGGGPAAEDAIFFGCNF